MQGSIKALVLTSLTIGAVLAALILAGNSLAAPATYCSNAEYWQADHEASAHQKVAHRLFNDDEYLDAYSEMLDAKYAISGSTMPCNSALRQVRTLTLLAYASWATGYKESYLEHYDAASRALKRTEGYLRQTVKVMKRVPNSAF